MHHYSSQPWWKTAQQVACDVWLQGKGMILVMFSQFFGASMNVMTQFLEIKGRDGKGFHPFQVRSISPTYLSAGKLCSALLLVDG